MFGSSQTFFFIITGGCNWLIYFQWFHIRLGFLSWLRWRWEILPWEFVIWLSYHDWLKLVNLSHMYSDSIGIFGGGENLWPESFSIYLFNVNGCSWLMSYWLRISECVFNSKLIQPTYSFGNLRQHNFICVLGFCFLLCFYYAIVCALCYSCFQILCLYIFVSLWIRHSLFVVVLSVCCCLLFCYIYFLFLVWLRLLFCFCSYIVRWFVCGPGVCFSFF